MNLRFLVIVPTYNNPQTIALVCNELLDGCSLDLLVIDDGSDIPVSSILPSDTPRLKVHRLQRNEGKGVALQAGFALAIARGYTHAITIDADLQHRAADIAAFVKRASSAPMSMIVGARVMSATETPGVSRFGRKFSDFWFRYQTGVSVDDTQSGFRCYPLYFVQGRSWKCRRYDFELEVLIDLALRGVEIQSIPVGVLYPADRVSHFDKLRDNVRISLFNTLVIIKVLFTRHWTPLKVGLAFVCAGVAGITFGISWLAFWLLFALCMGLRLNASLLIAVWVCSSLKLWLLLIAVKILVSAYVINQQSKLRAHRSWRGNVRGGRLGNQLLVAISKQLGLQVSYLCMFFVVPYFLIFAPQARHSSRQYAKMLGYGGARAFSASIPFILRHFYTFATLLLDRLYQITHPEQAFSVSITGKEHMLRVLASKQGSVILTAHFGALDIAAKAAVTYDVKSKLIRAEFVAPTGMTAEKVMRKNAVVDDRVPLIAQDQQSIFAFRELIDGGRSIVIMADRPQGKLTELVPFLDGLILVDTTGIQLARLTGCEILTAYGVKENMRSYSMYVHSLGYFPKVSNAQEAEQATLEIAKQYAKYLEKLLRRHPLQWSNFFNVWTYDLYRGDKLPQLSRQIKAPVTT